MKKNIPADCCIYLSMLIALTFLVTFRLSATEKKHPNVVILISDDQGWADIGYNNPRVYTPNLDRLATEGAILTSHYVMPQCTPTRVALMTGRYPGRFGTNALVASNVPVIPMDTPTLPAMFKTLGYETFMAGKWHLGSDPEYGPNHFGFDESYGSLAGAVGMYDHRYHDKPDTPYDPTWHRNHQIIPGYENGIHATDLIGRECVRFIQKKHDRPFFLYVAFHAPHTPLDERGPFTDIPTQPDPADSSRWLNEDRIPWFNDPAEKIQAEPERDKRLLLAAVYHLDSAVGDIIKALEETGVRENTLILFSSDNGPWVNNSGGGYPDNYPLVNYNQCDNLRGKKLDVYEGGIHVAGFINWPGVVQPGKVNQTVHIVDWFPTLAKLTGFVPEKPVPWDGTDIWPFVMGEKAEIGRSLYWVWNTTPDRWALRAGHHKIVRYSTEEPSDQEQWELYHIGNDPGEIYDISENNQEVVKKLHEMFEVQRKGDFRGNLLKSALNPE